MKPKIVKLKEGMRYFLEAQKQLTELCKAEIEEAKPIGRVLEEPLITNIKIAIELEDEAEVFYALKIRVVYPMRNSLKKVDLDLKFVELDL